MAELIGTITLLVGLTGMTTILFRKMPVLAELPVQESTKTNFLKSTLEKIKHVFRLKNGNSGETISKEVLLQKILSKIRILTLKIENKISDWLGKLRQKSLQKKNNFSDDYWQKLKDEKKNNNGPR